MSEHVFGIDGYITADVSSDEWLDAFLEWMESRGWQFGGITGETENATLKREMDLAKGLLIESHNYMIDVDKENAALKGLLRKHRQLIAGYGAGSERNLPELDALLGGRR